MHAAFTIAAKDLRQRLRDRSAIVLAFVAPLLVATLMSLAFRQSDAFHLDAALVDLDGGPVAAGFKDLLARPEVAAVVTAHPYDSVEAARSAVDDRTVQAAFVLPPGWSATIQSGGSSGITVLRNVNAAIAGDVAASLASGYASELDARRLAVAAVVHGGSRASDPAALAAAAAAMPTAEQLVERAAGTKPLKGISYYGPGMAIFFLFFIIGFTARGYFTDRRLGMLDRMLAAPVAAGTVLAGKALSVVVLGAASLLVMGVTTTLLLGADWGPPAAALAIGAAVVLAVTCLTMLVLVVSRTERQAEGFASIIVFGLALLGGNFVFISAAPALVRRLALVTPNGWALRGFTDLATGAGAGAAVVPVLAILAFCAVVGGVALAVASRSLR